MESNASQSSIEGGLIDRLHEARTPVDGVVGNPGAHYGDAIGGTGLPVVATCLCNVPAGQESRHRSAPAGVGVVVGAGFGRDGHRVAPQALLRRWDRTDAGR